MIVVVAFLMSIFPQLFGWHLNCGFYLYGQLCEPTMTAFMFPSIASQFKFNLLLQIFDGLYTYHVLSQGVPEANPFVSSTIAQWGAIWGIVYWKLLACALLALIFALRHFRRAMAMRALTLTSCVYSCLFFVSLYHLLLNF